MGGPYEYIYLSLLLCIQDRNRYICSSTHLLYYFTRLKKNQALFGLQCALL